MRTIAWLGLGVLFFSMSVEAAPGVGDEDAGALRALRELADIEATMLGDVQLERRENLKLIQRAGTALGAAAQRLGTTLDASASARVGSASTSDSGKEASSKAVATARAELAAAQAAIAGLMERQDALARSEEDHVTRLQALSRSLQLFESESNDQGPLQGTWQVTVNPTDDRGELVLRQYGTLVSGRYTMASGRTGSLSGTFVQDKLQFEIIDSKYGRDAQYYGVLSGDGMNLTGTWEAVRLGTGRAAFGHWKGRKDPPRSPAGSQP